MAEELNIRSNYMNKQEMYKELLLQVKSVIADEPDLIANLANVSAILKTYCSYHWVGFYQVKEKELVLGPFQGPLACTRIQYGKGVCGTAWKDDKVMVVDNVEEFPGHIACSTESKSEIVIPIHRNSEVFLVLDVDSDKIADFKQEDQNFLIEIAAIIEGQYK